MLQCTSLPKQVANWRHALRPMFHHRHQLVFCWWLVGQATSPEQTTINGLARLAPRHMAAWPLRRLLTAASWNGWILLW